MDAAPDGINKMDHGKLQQAREGGSAGSNVMKALTLGPKLNFWLKSIAALVVFGIAIQVIASLILFPAKEELDSLRNELGTCEMRRARLGSVAEDSDRIDFLEDELLKEKEEKEELKSMVEKKDIKINELEHTSNEEVVNYERRVKELQAFREGEMNRCEKNIQKPKDEIQNLKEELRVMQKECSQTQSNYNMKEQENEDLKSHLNQTEEENSQLMEKNEAQSKAFDKATSDIHTLEERMKILEGERDSYLKEKEKNEVEVAQLEEIKTKLTKEKSLYQQEARKCVDDFKSAQSNDGWWVYFAIVTLFAVVVGFCLVVCISKSSG